jgi:hypothetical protein
VVEHQLPKLSVVGSIPIARSKLLAFGAAVGRPTALQQNWPPRRNLPLIFFFDRPRHTG